MDAGLASVSSAVLTRPFRHAGLTAERLQMTNTLAVTAKTIGWRMFGACLGLCGGLLCAVAGSLLTAGSWVTREPHNKVLLSRLGGVLLYSTIPLLLLGGFCLDSPAAAYQRNETGEDD